MSNGLAILAGLPEERIVDLKLAGYLHDSGKADPRFQEWLAYGDPLGVDPGCAEEILAKSARPLPRKARVHSGLPEKWRHEALSVRFAPSMLRFAEARDQELVLWLIGTHHGHGRPFFPHSDPDDNEMRDRLPNVLGIPSTLPPGHGPQSLAYDWNGLDWCDLYDRLKTRYGVWDLARMEAILRLADHRASEKEQHRALKEQDKDQSMNTQHRLEGLEPDNPLAFLALLGLLRSLKAADHEGSAREKLHPRAAWDLDNSPSRPVLRLAVPASEQAISEAAAAGLATLAVSHDLGKANRPDLSYPYIEARAILQDAARTATASAHGQADLLAALMSDGAIKENKNPSAAVVQPTPLCLLFGQGHQHFLERLMKVPNEVAPPPRGRGKTAKTLSAAECLAEALFAPWRRQDPTFSFRWDPEEDMRYALMAGDPTDSANKAGTQHGANRLAAVGLAALTLVPETRAGRARPSVVGGSFEADGFSFAWPIWRDPLLCRLFVHCLATQICAGSIILLT